MEENPSLRIRAIGFPQYNRSDSFRYEYQQIESRLVRMAETARPYLTSIEINELPRLRDQLLQDSHQAYAADEVARTHEVDFWLEIELYFVQYQIQRTWQRDHLKEQPYVFCFNELAKALELSESVVSRLLIELNRSVTIDTPPLYTSQEDSEPNPSVNLSARQRALIHFFNNGPAITPATAKDYLEQWQVSSEDTVYNTYNSIAGKPHKRTGVAPGKIRRMIDDYEIVLQHLQGEAHENAQSELNTLMAKKEEYDSNRL